MSDKRKSGILLPVFSLDSDYGIGSFGKKAYEFVDFLRKSDQSFWQILPLGSISQNGNSPYLSPSSFAGNFLYIDIDKLIEKNLLKKEDVEGYEFDSTFVDYDHVAEIKDSLLRKAYANNESAKIVDIDCFLKEIGVSVYEYCFFKSLKTHFEEKSWLDFPTDVKTRKKETLIHYENLLKDEIRYNLFVQALFFEQYFELKKYANDNGIQIIGDLPIYISEDSSDMWQNPDLFLIDDDLSAKLVAGVPPDYFSEDGQYWANPVYDWDYNEREEFQWWTSRISHHLKMYDYLRLDHFRGFEAFWAIEKGQSAKTGKWIKAKGDELFSKLKEKHDLDRIIAEDLGIITEEVENLRKKYGFKGMKVMQFAFDLNDESAYLPHNVTEDSVYYTGTHDNQTLRGFLDTRTEQELNYIKDYVNSDDDLDYSFIKTLFKTNSNLCICQMQDYLLLGDDARINVPNTLGNWTWRLPKDSLTDELSEKISHITKLYNRN